MFGKSDPMCVLEFMGKDIAFTDVCDNTMDPVWFPDKKHTFKIRLPAKSKLPVLKVKVFDSDAPAIMSKVVSSTKTGDFLGEVTLKGIHLLHPEGEEFQTDLTPPPPDGAAEGEVPQKIMGKIYDLKMDPEKTKKYNKLVKGKISISIDRTKVDEQIQRKERAKHEREMKKNRENERYLNMAPPTAVVMKERAGMEGGLWVPKRFAEIKKGDDRHRMNYIEGECELRGLRDLYKLSFTNTRIIQKFKEAESDSDEDSDDDMVIERRVKQRVKLSLYMTKKKPKKRMADIEETGHLVKCDTPDGFIDGLIGKHAKTTNFDVSLKDCPNVEEFAGCVVVKRAEESPINRRAHYLRVRPVLAERQGDFRHGNGFGHGTGQGQDEKGHPGRGTKHGDRGRELGGSLQ